MGDHWHSAKENMIGRLREAGMSYQQAEKKATEAAQRVARKGGQPNAPEKKNQDR